MNIIPQGSDQSETVKAVCVDINLGSVSLDAYMLPNGEKRLGKVGSSLALGYAKNWLTRLPSSAPKQLEALQGMGFSGYLQPVKIIRLEGRGAVDAETISIRDFIKLVTYEASVKKNSTAITLICAFAETGLERILDDAFAGRSIDFLLEKIVHYTNWTADDWEEALQYNRDDIKGLYPY